MDRKYYLYVLLTKTPLKTGKFLRKVTNFEYNHCSISFDKNFKILYSFSRRHKNSTFYAGFTRESSLRYMIEAEKTKVQIFKIPLKPKTYKKLKKYLDDLIKHEDEYIYNYFSLVTYPFRKNVKVKKAYTCCEFTVHILRDFCKMADLGTKKGYCSIKELSKYLEPYLTYEGNFDVKGASWEEDKYLEKPNIFYKSYKTTGVFTSLFYRFFKGKITR